MFFREKADDLGNYLEARCDDGVTRFVVDATDAPIVCPHNWFRHGHKEQRVHYVARSAFGGGVILLHRELMNAPKGLTVDHIDGDGLNNRRHNLRLATWGENKSRQHNRKIGVSGKRGVHPTENGRWYSAIRIAGTLRYLGTFDTPDEAAAAWDAEALKERGEFAILRAGDRS